MGHPSITVSTDGQCLAWSVSNGVRRAGGGGKTLLVAGQGCCHEMNLWRRRPPGVVSAGVHGGSWVRPALRGGCAVAPPWSRAWRGGAALQQPPRVGARVVHRLMCSAAQGAEGAGAQLDEPVAASELETIFTAAQVEAAVERAAAGVGSFDGDLDAKFSVLSACAGLLGGQRIPNALLHTVQTPQQLAAYYLATLAPSDGDASLRAEELPPNLILDDRDEELLERVLRNGAQ